jgi:hypothetical protein
MSLRRFLHGHRSSIYKPSVDGGSGAYGFPALHALPAPLRRPSALLALVALLAVASLSSFLTFGYVSHRTPYAVRVGEPAQANAHVRAAAAGATTSQAARADLPPKARPHGSVPVGAAAAAVSKPEWPEALNGPPAKRFRGVPRLLSAHSRSC